MRKTLIAAVSGLALAWAGLAWAQQAGGTTDQQRAQDQQTQQQQQMQQHRDHSGMQGQAGARQGKLILKKADEVIGKEVVNLQGEQLGHIRELAIDGKTGQVAYAVLEFDRLADLRDKLFAVPWTALKTKAQAQRTGQAAEDRMRAGKEDETWYTDEEKEGTDQFVLNVSKDKLASAPGFNKDKWPEMADPQWGSDVHGFYGEKPYWEKQGRHGQTMRDREPGAGASVDVDVNRGGANVQADADRNRDQAAAQRDQTQTPGHTVQPGQQAQAGQQGQRMILKAEEQLLGKDIHNNQGEDIGELQNLMIDRRTGKIAFAVVKVDKAEGDKNMAALPWQQIDWKWNEQEKEGTLTLKSDMNQLKPHMFAENSWPDLSNRQYATALYRQFNARPYWETERGTEDVLGFQE